MAQGTQPLAAINASEPAWWHGAVIYQVYPRSLLDSKGDGIGDLPGITRKLDYIRDLGVDAIWVSPFFRSPMKDFGYDVSDYRAVDPMFGTLADFDALIERAHRLGLRVIIDQVLSHTSDQHPWFEESRRSRDNDQADWYVWADPKPDGTPPNNWLSIFGGSAWEWESRRQQYYLHNFLASQPDLNFHCRDVVDVMLDNVRFWLDRGVDGMRLDAVGYCFHDAQLRDNPAKPEAERVGQGFRIDNPYAFQRHVHDITQPENLGFLAELRALLDRYGAVSLGEITAEDTRATIAQYTRGEERLHTAYSFELLSDDFDAATIREAVEGLDSQLDNGWACWAVGNHDVARVATRWGGARANDALAKVIAAALLSLRGCACIYQGDELGLTEAEIPREAVRDPYGIAFWPTFKGRDGCRTPMPWTAAEATAGFTDGEPWLPIEAGHRARAVDVQEGDASSVLSFYRQFLAWRKHLPELQWGTIDFVTGEGDRLAFVREHEGRRLFCCFNFGPEPARFTLPGGRHTLIDLAAAPPVTVQLGAVELPAWGMAFLAAPGDDASA
ncbi:MAG: alpha-glucosidase [Pseudomonadota bacterium]